MKHRKTDPLIGAIVAGAIASRKKIQNVLTWVDRYHPDWVRLRDHGKNSKKQKRR